MQPVFVIARLVGPIFVVIGIGVLVNPSLYAASVAEGVGSPVLIYLSGLLMLTAGIAMLNGYRAWTRDWRAIVTVLGWLFTIGGIIRIVLPTVAASVAPVVYTGPTTLVVAGIIVPALGAILSLKGYRSAPF